MRDIWCCFVSERVDFADKMGDCGLDSIRRTNRICDFFFEKLVMRKYDVDIMGVE